MGIDVRKLEIRELVGIISDRPIKKFQIQCPYSVHVTCLFT